MAVVFKTRSAVETKKVAVRLAREIARMRRKKAIVMALSGNLGAGKTTFVQGFAAGLGAKGRVRSPTFVLMKIYPIAKFHVLPTKYRDPDFLIKTSQEGVGTSSKLQTLIHIDCYRLDKPEDMVKLGLKRLLKDPRAVVVIEWADRIKKLLPLDILWVEFRHGEDPHERILRIANSRNRI